MLWLTIIVIFILLLYLVVPRGTLLRETLDLPPYLLRHVLMRKIPMKKEKVKYGTHRHQYFLFFEPEEVVPRKKIAVIYFHGGSWRFGWPGFFRVNAQFFVERGYLAILPSYRHPPKHQYDAIRKDLNDLLVTLQTTLEERQYHDYQILLAGMSAGAHLSTMILFDLESLRKVGLSPHQFCGLLLCGAPLNFNLLPDHAVLRGFAGPRSGELFQIANPINYVDHSVQAPIMCFHGEKDGLIPLASIKSFINELQRLNIPVEFHVIKNGNHMSATRWLYRNGREKKLLNSWLEEVEQQNYAGS